MRNFVRAAMASKRSAAARNVRPFEVGPQVWILGASDMSLSLGCCFVYALLTICATLNTRRTNRKHEQTFQWFGHTILLVPTHSVVYWMANCFVCLLWLKRPNKSTATVKSLFQMWCAARIDRCNKAVTIGWNVACTCGCCICAKGVDSFEYRSIEERNVLKT